MSKGTSFADNLFNSEIAPIWDFLSNWRVELSFPLSDGRCVWKELYAEYQPHPKDIVPMDIFAFRI
jgi:hypothetical protein